MKHLALLALLVFSAPALTADIKGELPCRIQAGIVSGAADRATTHEAPEGELKTSVGTLTWTHDHMYQLIPVINGKIVQISKDNQGNFGNGKVIDLGGKLVIAYQVERMEDSGASPSLLTLLVGSDGQVIEEHLVDGQSAWEYPCALVN